MNLSDEAGLARVLESFGVGVDALLGRGGEAHVYALDADRVLRVHHVDTRRSSVERRNALLAELAPGAADLPFAIPAVLDTVEREGHIVVLERRLPGRPLNAVLRDASGASRETLVRAHLDAAARIGDIALGRPGYGELCSGAPIRAETFREYLEARAAESLRRAGPDFSVIDPGELARALPEPEGPALVHMDAFAGNMLALGESITAVIDFGTVSIAGDRRIDPLAAAAYLDPPITPTATVTDRSIAREWLAERGLDELYGPARRWLAAFWSAALDDAALAGWCRSILLD